MYVTAVFMDFINMNDDSFINLLTLRKKQNTVYINPHSHCKMKPYYKDVWNMIIPHSGQDQPH